MHTPHVHIPHIPVPVHTQAHTQKIDIAILENKVIQMNFNIRKDDKLP